MADFTGIWITMITPFTQDGLLDEPALERLVDHFAQTGADGLFAVCQSSEMAFLSPKERKFLANRVVSLAAGRIRVIVSGHASAAPEEQLEDVQRALDSGAEAAVLLTSLPATQSESDATWIRRMEWLLSRIPTNANLGLYECPWPYKRLLSPTLTRFCAESGRFTFLKETSCTLEGITEKIRIAEGSPLRILNANSQLLLPSIRAGADGFSGIMANMQASLYAYLWHKRDDQQHAQLHARLADYLAATSATEGTNYPICAKFVLNEMGAQMGLYSRSALSRAYLDEATQHQLRCFVRANAVWEEECRETWGRL